MKLYENSADIFETLFIIKFEEILAAVFILLELLNDF
jgi:hypothetical protein